MSCGLEITGEEVIVAYFNLMSIFLKCDTEALAIDRIAVVESGITTYVLSDTNQVR